MNGHHLGRTGLTRGLFLSAMLALPAAALGQAQPVPSKPVDLNSDSGLLSNSGNEPRVVWSEIIEARGAGWLRLYFESVDLDPDYATAESSIIRIMSLEDGGTQNLNAWTIKEWYNSTAYFNGETLSVELIARPGSRNNRVVLDHIDVGIVDETVGPATICGTTDDRVPSADARSGRAMPIGCSAWLINDSNHQFITAGHCSSSSLQVIQFNVPLSDGNGTPRNPGPEDQYSVDIASKQSQSGSIGQDWGYFGVFRNTETGLSAYQAQGEFHVLASTPPQVNGQTINITGYGTTGNGVPREWNQVQKIHTGPFWQFSGTTIRYRVDTSGGNSGSCVLDESTGLAIGVHTHAGCDSSSNSSNQGTGINHTGWQTALANPRGVCAPFTLTVPSLFAGQQATFQAAQASAGQTVYFLYSLQGTGETLLPNMGVTLGILNPKLGGSAVADGNGNVSMTRLIPQMARGATLTLQAIEAGRVSTISTRLVN